MEEVLNKKEDKEEKEEESPPTLEVNVFDEVKGKSVGPGKHQEGKAIDFYCFVDGKTNYEDKNIWIWVGRKGNEGFVPRSFSA